MISDKIKEHITLSVSLATEGGPFPRKTDSQTAWRKEKKNKPKMCVNGNKKAEYWYFPDDEM